MKRILDKFLELNVKNARARAERRGRNFNEEKFVKKQKAAIPSLIWYGVMILFVNFFPGLIPAELFLIIFVILILKGLNDYFGWIKIAQGK